MKRVRIFVPRETAAVSMGADEVAVEFARLGKARQQQGGAGVELIRTGSRGAAWLEPLVEVDVDGRRVGYANVELGDVAALFAADLATGPAHPRRVGFLEDMPWFADQTRWTFRRAGLIDPLSIDDYRMHGGYAGLERTLAGNPAEVIDAVRASGLRSEAASPPPKTHEASPTPTARRRRHRSSPSRAAHRGRAGPRYDPPRAAARIFLQAGPRSDGQGAT